MENTRVLGIILGKLKGSIPPFFTENQQDRGGGSLFKAWGLESESRVSRKFVNET